MYTINIDPLYDIYKNMTPKDLKSAGMGTKEAGCYLALLELGEASMGELVKKSKLKRTTLYDVLDSLKEKNLVSLSKKGKRVTYVAESPKKLIEGIDENKRNLEKLLPELLSVANSITKKPKVRYFEGVEGVKEVYRDILRYPNQKIQAWVPENIIDELDKSFFEDFYTPARLQNKIWAEIIASDLPLIRHYSQFDKVSLRTTKLVDPLRFPFSVEICLYGRDKIGVMSYKDKMGLVIESESITKTLKSIFDLQWGTLP